MRFLESDPSNLNLLADAANAAFDAGDFDKAKDLFARHEALAPLPAPLLNLNGMIALAEQRFEDAETIFEGLRDGGEDDPALRFNLAWAMAMTSKYEEALALLDDAAVASAPRGPSMKVHVLHHLGRYDEALACGAELAKRYPNNEALMGALATLAMDAEKEDLVRHYGEQAGRNAEGRAALGFLALGAQDATTSLKLFDEVIAAQPGNPRAWIGKGLGLLAKGDASAGAKAIDHGAEIFQSHIGSWIASGWAHFVNGENEKARASFEKALAIDDNFAESHGGLAVLDILEGKLDEAKRESQIALRLDKRSLGGALAASLLAERAGNPKLAEKIREIALNTPIGPNNQTIAQALVGFGIRPPK